MLASTHFGLPRTRREDPLPARSSKTLRGASENGKPVELLHAFTDDESSAAATDSPFKATLDDIAPEKTMRRYPLLAEVWVAEGATGGKVEGGRHTSYYRVVDQGDSRGRLRVHRPKDHPRRSYSNPLKMDIDPGGTDWIATRGVGWATPASRTAGRTAV